MIGSFAFAAGALLSFLPSLPSIVPGIIFFLGSLFFTTAAYLQYFESINTSPVPLTGKDRVVFITWEPRRIDWWITATQLIGTFFFNISTFNALRTHLSTIKIDKVVWSADVFGSILFLVSSWLAYGEADTALTGKRWNSLTWWIVLSNLLGSVAFGLSALTSFVIPSTGELINAVITNLTTFLGAVGFFVGALLQLREIDIENAERNLELQGETSVTTSSS
ncbi:MAG TPA: hypothetical protein VIY29_16940 [Ktedonobacteraceae bacterium]